MINDKKYRLSLIEKYLNAETSVKEENMLAKYYASHKADADEEAIAKQILMCFPPDRLVSVEAVEEFDNIVAKAKKKSIRIWKWTISGIAAAIALIFFLRPAEKESPAFMDVFPSLAVQSEFGHVTNVSTEQLNEMVFLTLTLDDGQELSFVTMDNLENDVVNYFPVEFIE